MPPIAGQECLGSDNLFGRSLIDMERAKISAVSPWCVSKWDVLRLVFRCFWIYLGRLIAICMGIWSPFIGLPTEGMKYRYGVELAKDSAGAVVSH